MVQIKPPFQTHRFPMNMLQGVLKCCGSVVAVCCSVLQCVAVSCSELQCVAVVHDKRRAHVLQCALQCVAVCCSVLQCVAASCRV